MTSGLDCDWWSQSVAASSCSSDCTGYELQYVESANNYCGIYADSPGDDYMSPEQAESIARCSKTCPDARRDAECAAVSNSDMAFCNNDHGKFCDDCYDCYFEALGISSEYVELQCAIKDCPLRNEEDCQPCASAACMSIYQASECAAYTAFELCAYNAWKGTSYTSMEGLCAGEGSFTSYLDDALNEDMQKCTEEVVEEYGDSSDGDNGLSVGAIAGIVIGCLVGAGLIVAVAAFFMFRGRNTSFSSQSSSGQSWHGDVGKEQDARSTSDIQMQLNPMSISDPGERHAAYSMHV